MKPPQEWNLVEQPMVPVLRDIRDYQHNHKLDDPWHAGDGCAEGVPTPGVLVDNGRWRERKKAQQLDEHRADQKIE